MWFRSCSIWNYRRLTGQAVPQPKSGQNICILVSVWYPTKLFRKEISTRCLTPFWSGLGDLKPRFLENLIVFRNDCIFSYTNFRFESCTHKSQHVFTEKIRFSSIYIKNMVIQVNSWIFGQVNHHIDEESCKFKLSKCVDDLTTFSWKWSLRLTF